MFQRLAIEVVQFLPRIEDRRRKRCLLDRQGNDRAHLSLARLDQHQPSAVVQPADSVVLAVIGNNRRRREHTHHQHVHLAHAPSYLTLR